MESFTQLWGFILYHRMSSRPITVATGILTLAGCVECCDGYYDV